MPTVNHKISVSLSRSVRARQIESAFDIPAQQKCELTFSGELPIEDFDWNIGLIVGASGSGKSTILNHVFGHPVGMQWGAASVIDDFSDQLKIDDIIAACQAVGFNTMPAWLRPFAVLSNGEKFRVEIARKLLESPPNEIIALDEFTSVVDRQVARIASHAVQKFVRKNKRRMVAASCHYDIIDWLQPDWVFEPATMTFTRRLLQRRPGIEVEISRCNYEAWKLFAPFHYMTAALHKAAVCYLLNIDGRPAAFAGVLQRPHPRVHDVYGISRMVTLPDFQGLGLAFVLMGKLGAAYKAIGRRLHMYPAHPSFILAADKSKEWALIKKPGFSQPSSLTKTSTIREKGFGGRGCAVFAYAGDAMDKNEALKFVA